MKHIISLSLKYISRQKSRTLLTFLCVMLSVFILCSFGAYSGSLLQTMRNETERTSGKWEADISEWVERLDDKKKAVDTIQNHVVVDDYFISFSNFSAEVNTDRMKNDGVIEYFEFSDGSNRKNLVSIGEYFRFGNYELLDEFERDYVSSGDADSESGGTVVPEWFRDMGYSVGDTITFTITPVRGKIDENSQAVREAREFLNEKYGTSVFVDDEEFADLSEDEKEKNPRLKMCAYMKRKGLFDSLGLKDEERGESSEITLKIAGFSSSYDSHIMTLSGNYTGEYFLDDLFRKNESFEKYDFLTAKVRITDNADFEDSISMLYENLGYKRDNYYADLPKLNTELLFTEFKSTAAIVAMMPFIIVFLVLIFFAWLVSRFVIDNAFEISNQERSSQFAALRVMGASKAQITALVFTEAVVYTVTAIPVGCFLAYALCSSVMNRLSRMGFQDFEFKANGYFIILSVVLCMLAIFISSYTSAVWASRKLSPAEALNFGKPTKKKEKTNKRKSKINLSSSQFLRRYTNKNIMRNKGRYIISTVTMAFGVMFFTFAVIIGVFFKTYVEEEIGQNSRTDDFTIMFENVDRIDEVSQAFYNEDVFSDAKVGGMSGFRIDSLEVGGEPVKSAPVRGGGHIGTDEYINVMAVDRIGYEKFFGDMTNLTYNDFVKSGGSFLNTFCESEEERFYSDVDEKIEVHFTYNDNAPLTITGVSHCDIYDEDCIIVPLDSDFTKAALQGLFVRAKVNGNDRYDEALEIYESFAYGDGVVSYANRYSFGTGLSEFIKAVTVAVSSFVVSVWLVGILSMVNSINTSVFNRSRELMMLRSVGMSMKQLRKTIVLESVAFSSVASSAGTIIGVATFLILSKSIGSAPEIMVSAAVAIIASIIVNIAISAVASVPALRNLKKAESLARASY